MQHLGLGDKKGVRHVELLKNFIFFISEVVGVLKPVIFRLSDAYLSVTHCF